ncbi:MAG: hypothetical protein ACLFQI_01420 [Halochromatium sp.]|uniref:hypothetical protein n=1 Tax=Halochromatium sp. TaxID=2049430 RepID=UPI00397E7BCA
MDEVVHVMPKQSARDVQMSKVVLDPLAEWRFARDELVEVVTVNRERFFYILIHLLIELGARLVVGLALSR